MLSLVYKVTGISFSLQCNISSIPQDNLQSSHMAWGLPPWLAWEPKEAGTILLPTRCERGSGNTVSSLKWSHCFCLFVCLLFRAAPQHMEVPRLGIESELQLPAFTTATATQDLSHICDLHHSSWQRQILDPPREARDGTSILMHTSRICFH